MKTTKIEGWRVTTTDGTVIPVAVRTQDGDYWASIPGCVGACKQTPLLAVAWAASAAMLDVAEILAPGVPTRDEARAEVERLRGALSGLVLALKEYARNADGIPEDIWDAFRAACMATGMKDPGDGGEPR